MTPVYLETERLRLREMAADEAALLFDLDSDPEVMKYLTAGVPSTIEACEKAMVRMRALYEKHNGCFGYWFAEIKNTGEIIGWFLLRPDHHHPEDTDNPELGYRLKKKYWGRGYATEGSCGLLKKAFEEFDVASVFAITMLGNRASQNVMKKLGMTFIKNYLEEQACGPNGAREAVRYSISKTQYQSSQSQ